MVAGVGGNRALIALRSGVTRARLRPDLSRLRSSPPLGVRQDFAYTLAPSIPDCDTEARMFCPALGIAEDPVSGNAHALLAAQLCAGALSERSGTPEFTARRTSHGPSRIASVRVSADSGAAGSGCGWRAAPELFLRQRRCLSKRV